VPLHPLLAVTEEAVLLLLHPPAAVVMAAVVSLLPRLLVATTVEVGVPLLQRSRAEVAERAEASSVATTVEAVELPPLRSRTALATMVAVEEKSWATIPGELPSR
jgi:hypothetical protein